MEKKELSKSLNLGPITLLSSWASHTVWCEVKLSLRDSVCSEPPLSTGRYVCVCYTPPAHEFQLISRNTLLLHLISLSVRENSTVLPDIHPRTAAIRCVLLKSEPINARGSIQLVTPHTKALGLGSALAAAETSSSGATAEKQH